VADERQGNDPHKKAKKADKENKKAKAEIYKEIEEMSKERK
jgi:hypothetical protein